MPSKKVKAEDKAPSTPDKKAKSKSKAKTDVEVEPQTPKKDTPAKAKATPKKTKPDITIDFKPVVAEPSGDAPLQVTVTSERENGLAYKKGGSMRQVLMLEGAQSFSVPKTIILTEGPYAGMQAVLIRPAKPFDFKRLPEEVRGRVYRFYFASKGVVGENIVLDGKRPSNKEVFAKTYAEGSKNRVALLAIDKKFGKEATDIFYSHTLKFDSTTTLIDFISQAQPSVRLRLRSVSIKSYNKSTARNAMHFLAEAKHLKHLRFESGVFSEGHPTKAAKAFYGDAYKFLQAIGAEKGSKDAGVDLLEFANGSLRTKDGAESKNWPDALVDEFKKKLRARLK